MNETSNVILAGVGGQGVILISELVAMVAARAGHDVTQTEVHGIAQRGGSVHSHVRFGSKVYSPLIKPGGADVLIATEKLEGLRFAHYVRDGGVMVINSYELPPIRSEDRYPYGDQVADFLRDKGFYIVTFNATERAMALGNPRVSNVMLLGAASLYLDIAEEIWQATLEDRLPARLLEINRRSFAEGMQVAKGMKEEAG